jgi:hypothetical protein
MEAKGAKMEKAGEKTVAKGAKMTKKDTTAAKKP